MTESGAHKGMMLDFCESIGLALPEPSPASQEIIGAIAPDLILPTNPLDLTAQSLIDPDLYRKTHAAAARRRALRQPGADDHPQSVAHNPRKLRRMSSTRCASSNRRSRCCSRCWARTARCRPRSSASCAASACRSSDRPSAPCGRWRALTEFAARRPAASHRGDAGAPANNSRPARSPSSGQS